MPRVVACIPATLGLVILALMGACREPLIACNLNLVYGLRVVVTDSASGALLGGSATVVGIREGAYVDSVQELGDGEYYGAGERAGTYSVTVQRPGYRVWAKDGVRVREDECHVIPVELSARLQAL